MNVFESSSSPSGSTPEVDSPPGTGKPAWNPAAIAWSCLFFTILPGGIMYALNFERLGQPERKKRALFFVVIGALIYHLIFFHDILLPEIDARVTELIPRIWFQFINITVAWYFYLGQYQLFARHIRQGDKKAPLYIPLLLSGLWLLIILGGVAGTYLLLGSRDSREFQRAVILTKTKNYREAEVIFKKYKAKYPEETSTYWDLAVIYSNTNRNSMAEQELKQLLERQPGNEKARRFLRKIESP